MPLRASRPDRPGGGWILNLSSRTVLHPDPAPYEPKNRSYVFHQHMSPTLYGSTKAALQLCSRPQAQLSGRCVLSLPLLRELGVQVHTLDGSAALVMLGNP